MEPYYRCTDLLDFAVAQGRGRGIVYYGEDGCEASTAQWLSYPDFQRQALQRARGLRDLSSFRVGGVVLIHFSQHVDNLLWFWATLYAGCVPALSTPLPRDPTQRSRHLDHLQKLLQNPLCVTDDAGHEALASSGRGLDTMIASKIPLPMAIDCEGDLINARKHLQHEAALMLTSGSTGMSKAVALSHKQIMYSVKGKSTILEYNHDQSLLNWIGVDHVAALLETHLEALYVGCTQVHAQPAALIQRPRKFFDLVERHQTQRTFAPNFFLSSLMKSLNSDSLSAEQDWDLSCLRCLVSGGEPNPVKVTHEFGQLLEKFGASRLALMPAFGMTETCAGSIYNTFSPTYTCETSRGYASLGRCIPGIKMRVTHSAVDGSSFHPSDKPKDVTSSSVQVIRGQLEVHGPAVFEKYYNDAAATAVAFTEDGWFKTGDEAEIDEHGMLHIVGRIKETVLVNGVTIHSAEIEAALDTTTIAGAVPTYWVAFAYREQESEHERLCVAYLPSYKVEDQAARLETNNTIARTVLLRAGIAPKVLPLDETVLQKSSLGKLSRGKVKQAFLAGALKKFTDRNETLLAAARTPTDSEKLTDSQRRVLEVAQEVLGEDQELAGGVFGIDTPLIEVGMTSIQMLKLKHAIAQNFAVDLPVSVVINNPTVSGLHDAIQKSSQTVDYDPVVVLRGGQGKSKQPLWLFHPGVGEVLVFLGLAKIINDRPVYALRARGFQPGEKHFADINDAVDTYHAAIKRLQPQGPYVVAGYSYGAMLTFETAKRLEARGDEVAFMGSINLPPHIRDRMQQLTWLPCILHLAFFLSLISESALPGLQPTMVNLSKEEVTAAVLRLADQNRVAELALTHTELRCWADLAFAMQNMAVDYEPAGTVAAVDVFFCEPLAAVAENKREWVERRLSKWQDFSRSEVKFHDVQGAHYTILNPDHVYGFYHTLQLALHERGV